MAFSYIPTYVKKQQLLVLFLIAILLQCIIYALGYITQDGPLTVIHYLANLVGCIFTVYVLARLFGPLPEGSLVCSTQNNMGQNNMGQNNYMGRNNMGQNNMGRNNMGQNNMGRNNMGQNNTRQPF
jgi:hypothetical protein